MFLIAAVWLMTFMYNVLYIYFILANTNYGSLPPLSLAPSLLQSCNVFTIVYTVCNAIVIQFIHKALGLNKPVLCLLRVCGKHALYNVRVPDGCQLVSAHGWLCHLFSPSSLCVTAREDFQLTQHLPC